ncbi:MAG TPA: hypothetical protein VMU22_11385 [Rhizomicrobium sp.]|nr:hypothetical protein [Rhizomicrobium sp.]
MAIVVPTLIVGGIALFIHGLFHILSGGISERVTGSILIALSAASLGFGTLGTLSVLR